MDKRYEQFTAQFIEAYKRWTGTELDPHKLDPYSSWRISQLFDKGMLGSTISILPSQKSVSFMAEDDDGFLQEIWREEYESLDEIAQSWLALSKEELRSTHYVESEAFFGEADF